MGSAKAYTCIVQYYALIYILVYQKYMRHNKNIVKT